MTINVQDQLIEQKDKLIALMEEDIAKMKTIIILKEKTIEETEDEKKKLKKRRRGK